jgi:hypothetical protein
LGLGLPSVETLLAPILPAVPAATTAPAGLTTNSTVAAPHRSESIAGQAPMLRLGDLQLNVALNLGLAEVSLNVGSGSPANAATGPALGLNVSSNLGSQPLIAVDASLGLGGNQLLDLGLHATGGLGGSGDVNPSVAAASVGNSAGLDLGVVPMAGQVGIGQPAPELTRTMQASGSIAFSQATSASVSADVRAVVPGVPAPLPGGRLEGKGAVALGVPTGGPLNNGDATTPAPHEAPHARHEGPWDGAPGFALAADSVLENRVQRDEPTAHHRPSLLPEIDLSAQGATAATAPLEKAATDTPSVNALTSPFFATDAILSPLFFSFYSVGRDGLGLFGNEFRAVDGAGRPGAQEAADVAASDQFTSSTLGSLTPEASGLADPHPQFDTAALERALQRFLDQYGELHQDLAGWLARLGPLPWALIGIALASVGVALNRRRSSDFPCELAARAAGVLLTSFPAAAGADTD